ncbi:MAG: hypothetical protein GX416_10550 [Bacteroidales bacterium]|nr:hypothetical protein [Bacteroidales bacterium]
MKCKRIIFTTIASLFWLMSYADLEDHGKDYSIDDSGSDLGYKILLLLIVIGFIIYGIYHIND